MTTTVLQLRAVGRTHGTGGGEVVALAAVDLEVCAGEVVAVMGPSGSGKTTLLAARRVERHPGRQDGLVGPLVERAARLVRPGGRALLGITGPPGAGKSTLAAELVAALTGSLSDPLSGSPGAVLVPMDGFHLDDAELDRLGRRDRKGAPDTFDAAGYVALLRRLHDRTDDVVWAPLFDRTRELAVAGALAVPRETPLVVTEGNYLLAGGAFAPVRGLLTECWYVDLDPVVRLERLVARHVAHGRTPEQARAWAEGSDEGNAVLVAATRSRADLAVPGC